MSDTVTSSPATNVTTQFGRYPTYLVSAPYKTVAAAASTVATSATFGATQVAALNNCMATFVALGYWATS